VRGRLYDAFTPSVSHVTSNTVDLSSCREFKLNSTAETSVVRKSKLANDSVFPFVFLYVALTSKHGLNYLFFLNVTVELK
jgi:hypothetical protein